MTEERPIDLSLPANKHATIQPEEPKVEGGKKPFPNPGAVVVEQASVPAVNAEVPVAETEIADAIGLSDSEKATLLRVASEAARHGGDVIIKIRDPKYQNIVSRAMGKFHFEARYKIDQDMQVPALWRVV